MGKQNLAVFHLQQGQDQQVTDGNAEKEKEVGGMDDFVTDGII